VATEAHFGGEVHRCRVRRWVKDTSENGVGITVATAVILAFLGEP
jgi:hypothetical protein